MSCGVDRRRGSDLALLWLWYRLADVAPTWPLAQEPPYAQGAALRKKKKNRVMFTLNKQTSFSTHKARIENSKPMSPHHPSRDSPLPLPQRCCSWDMVGEGRGAYRWYRERRASVPSEKQAGHQAGAILPHGWHPCSAWNPWGPCPDVTDNPSE